MRAEASPPLGYSLLSFARCLMFLSTNCWRMSSKVDEVVVPRIVEMEIGNLGMGELDLCLFQSLKNFDLFRLVRR